MGVRRKLKSLEVVEAAKMCFVRKYDVDEEVGCLESFLVVKAVEMASR